MAEFVRFQSMVPNRRGRFPGVFALVNGLASQGMLSLDDDDDDGRRRTTTGDVQVVAVPFVYPDDWPFETEQ
ncbi:MAG: hypothetical protein PGN24_02270 [Microbacterium arborescens]